MKTSKYNREWWTALMQLICMVALVAAFIYLLSGCGTTTGKSIAKRSVDGYCLATNEVAKQLVRADWDKALYPHNIRVNCYAQQPKQMGDDKTSSFFECPVPLSPCPIQPPTSPTSPHTPVHHEEVATFFECPVPLSPCPVQPPTSPTSPGGNNVDAIQIEDITLVARKGWSVDAVIAEAVAVMLTHGTTVILMYDDLPFLLQPSMTETQLQQAIQRIKEHKVVKSFSQPHNNNVVNLNVGLPI